MQIIVIAKVTQNRPANLHLQFLDQNLLECLESFKSDAFICLSCIKIVTFEYEQFFKSRNIILFECLIEDFLLEICQFFITEIPIVISIKDAEYSQKSFLKVRS